MCTWYFSYVFLDQNDISFSQKVTALLLILPLVLLLPTEWNLLGFDLASCEAQQGILVKYFYLFQIIFLIRIIIYLVKKYRSKTDKLEKEKVLFFSAGVILFLTAFSWGNVFASLTLQWEVEQYGLFGMPVFMIFLMYLIVRYRAFNVKLLAVQALVTVLVFLVGAQLFFPMGTAQFTMVGLTLIFLLLVGRILVLSVEKEIDRKEELQEISDRLTIANTELHRLDNAKSEFISIASHQLRTPLTAIKGFVSLLLEGAYGRLEPSVADTLNKVYLANARLMNLVENLLNISRIEAGRIQYQFAPTKLEDILTELHELFILAAHEKGLRLGIALPKTPLPILSLDGGKIREVISNVIDNSIKYTEKGDVLVAAELKGSKVVVTVSDTGVGIDPEDLPHLFKKFERGKDAAQVNVSSTGLGLYVGKSFIEAHGGTIRAESAGKGKGARFVLELPVHRDAA